jgi:hypothetical protein
MLLSGTSGVHYRRTLFAASRQSRRFLPDVSCALGAIRFVIVIEANNEFSYF